jgi:GntR family transcriptional repressor for pyruvate dehydrogenase complex
MAEAQQRGIRTPRTRQSSGFAAEVADTLRIDIESGAFNAGDRLPSEHQIADQFGVSRAVVREAIGVLRHDGVVESYQGRGSFVSSAPRAKTYRLPEPNLWDAAEMVQFFQFLSAHEVAATRLAADRRSGSDLAVIRKALDGMATAIANGRLGADEDFQFHAGIYAATHNPFFISFSAFLEQRVRRLIRTARTNTARFAGLAASVQEEHREIFDAIVDRDPEAAGRAAEHHLINAAKRLRLYRRTA